jgi:hypothetical protein
MSFNLLYVSQANAVIPYALRSSVMRHFPFASTRNFSKGIDFSAIQPIESARLTKTKDVERIIPSGMAPTRDGGMVARQIIDHSLSSWFNSEQVRNSSLGRSAHQVEQKLSSNVSVGGGAPEAVHHNFRFQMRAAQTKAQLEYSGLTHAKLTYYVAQQQTDLEVREPLKILRTDLVFKQQVSRVDQRQTLNLRWSW